MIHQPIGNVNPIISPWPFAQWGLDIIGPFPQVTGNRRFVLVAMDYFTIWVEGKALDEHSDKVRGPKVTSVRQRVAVQQ